VVHDYFKNYHKFISRFDLFEGERSYTGPPRFSIEQAEKDTFSKKGTDAVETLFLSE
jgi:hypothetical protein